MGNQLSVEASDILEKAFSRFLLVEGGSPLRLDIITALRKRFPSATTEHFYPDSPEKLEDMVWSGFDLVMISCPSSICAELSWLNIIKERNTAPGGPLLIVLTGNSETGREAIWEGADVYLPHEVTKVEFSARLDAALEVERLFRCYPLILPDWHMLEVLHNSENAVIFLAENRAGHKAVVKRFKCDVSGVPEDVLQRFFRDARILIENHNEHLVHFIDAGVSESAPYLVMEYIEGVTLKYMLDEFSRHSMECRLDWFRQVVSGLSRVHELGLLHRDLKSSNILIREDGTAVLLDFGVEYQLLMGAGFLNENEIYCTPYYVSPERMIGEPASVQSDLYALGILLYEILVGDKPYLGRSLTDILQQHMFAETPELPEKLRIYQPLLSSLLAKSPEGRKSSAAAVLSWLDEYV